MKPPYGYNLLYDRTEFKTGDIYFNDRTRAWEDHKGHLPDRDVMMARPIDLGEEYRLLGWDEPNPGNCEVTSDGISWFQPTAQLRQRPQEHEAFLRGSWLAARVPVEKPDSEQQLPDLSAGWQWLRAGPKGETLQASDQEIKSDGTWTSIGNLLDGSKLLHGHVARYIGESKHEPEPFEFYAERTGCGWDPKVVNAFYAGLHEGYNQGIRGKPKPAQ